jgi:predicted nucleic acid-binding protein
MILFDTSVWIDYLNARPTPKVQKLEAYFKNNFRVFITPTIIQEVLQGISDQKRFNKVQQILINQNVLLMKSVEAAIKAAQLYSSLRQKGVTIRKPNDCLIAVYALNFDIEICHNDSDFDLIAQNSLLKISH